MSERERKSKGEPGRALPNLPKFLQGKSSPPPEKPPATPPAPMIPPIEGAGPAAKKPKAPAPIPAKSNQPALNQPKAPPFPSSPPNPVTKATKHVEATQPAAKTPPALPGSRSTGSPPSARPSKDPAEDSARVASARATKSSAIQPAAAKSVPAPTAPKPIASVATTEPKVASIESTKAPSAETKREEAPEPPAPADPALSSSQADSAAIDRPDAESALDDVLPQAVSVSIVREAMAAEKAYRPILFAGPLKRVAKAAPATRNGAAVVVSSPQPSVAEEKASPTKEAPIAATASAVSESRESAEAIDPSHSHQPAESIGESDGAPAGSNSQVAEGGAAKSGPEAAASERRKSKRRKAVSSVLLAAAYRAKEASAADAQERGESGRSFADPWDYLRAAAATPTPAEGPTIRSEVAPGEGEITPENIVRKTPPFVASLLLHVVLIVALALIVLPGFEARKALELDMNYATEDSELLQAIALDLPNEMEIETDDPFSTDLAEVADPLASALELPDSFGSFDLMTPGTLGQPSVGFSGRDEGTKQALLSAFGGTVATEDSVKLGLGWMKRQQQPDGRWLLSGPYTNGCSLDNPAAATSMALLAFLGDGNTPTEGEFRQTVTKGADALLRFQDSDGNFYVGPEGQHRLYTQAQATIAVCELYGMTGDERFREAAELAVEYCLRSQAPEGGWRYYPGQESDTSVTGWFVMALKSAEMAGIDVPQESFDRISAYLDKVQDEEGWRYKYRIIERDYSKTMTAEAVLCRQYLGWDRDDLRMKKAVDYLLESPIQMPSIRLAGSTPSDGTNPEVYYWYYASQTMHHYGGEEWEAWNANLREVLPAIQEKKGREQGSWSPRDDEWGSVGGRLFMTSLCLYTLEIYYRHLPLYQQAGEGTARP